MATQQINWPYVINLGNSIIGVSILAMPFCFKECGVVLGMLLLFSSAWLTHSSCNLLIKAAVTARRRTYEFLALHTFGPAGKLAVEVSIIGMLIGTAIAFHVIIGDLGPAIVSKFTGLENNSQLRTVLMFILAMFVALPLGLMRSLDSISNISAISIGFYAVFIAEVFTLAFPNLWSGVWVTKVVYWNPEGVFKCLPIFSLAFACQTQLFVMYDALPEPSLHRMNTITKSAIGLCTASYLCVGYFGYVAFCDEEISGDILLNFRPTIFSEAVKFGFVLSIAVSFPLVIFPCRSAIYMLLYAKGHPDKEQGIHENMGSANYIPPLHFKIITVCIVLVTLVIGLFVPNVEFILAMTGATMGCMISFIFPAVMFISIMSMSKTSSKSTAQVVLFLGVTILLASTYVTLNTQDKVVAQQGSVVKIAPPDLLAQDEKREEVPAKLPSPLPIIKDPVIDKPKDGEGEEGNKHSDQEQAKPVESKDNVQKDAVENKQENTADKDSDKRQEPPIPHAPDDTVEDKGKPVEKEEAEETAREKVDEIKEEKVHVKNVSLPVVKDAVPKELLEGKISEDKKEKTAQETDIKEPKSGKENGTLQQKQGKDDQETKQLLAELKLQHEEQKQLIEAQKELIEEMKEHKKEAHSPQETAKPKLEQNQNVAQPVVSQKQNIPQGEQQQQNAQQQGQQQQNIPQGVKQQQNAQPQGGQQQQNIPQGVLQQQNAQQQGQQEQNIPHGVQQQQHAQQQGGQQQQNILQGVQQQQNAQIQGVQQQQNIPQQAQPQQNLQQPIGGQVPLVQQQNPPVVTAKLQPLIQQQPVVQQQAAQQQQFVQGQQQDQQQPGFVQQGQQLVQQGQLEQQQQFQQQPVQQQQKQQVQQDFQQQQLGQGNMLGGNNVQGGNAQQGGNIQPPLVGNNLPQGGNIAEQGRNFAPQGGNIHPQGGNFLPQGGNIPVQAAQGNPLPQQNALPQPGDNIGLQNNFAANPVALPQGQNLEQGGQPKYIRTINNVLNGGNPIQNNVPIVNQNPPQGQAVVNNVLGEDSQGNVRGNVVQQNAGQNVPQQNQVGQPPGFVAQKPNVVDNNFNNQGQNVDSVRQNERKLNAPAA